jgi:hypothetical protein
MYSHLQYRTATEGVHYVLPSDGAIPRRRKRNRAPVFLKANAWRMLHQGKQTITPAKIGENTEKPVEDVPYKTEVGTDV